jgi:hypothetical protein
MKSLLIVGFLALMAGEVSAADRLRIRSRSVTTTSSCGETTTAQHDATVMARTGRFRHSGGAGCREGIGFSTSSPEDALNRCCYSGQYPVAEESVVRGNGGWYAVRRYAR